MIKLYQHELPTISYLTFKEPLSAEKQKSLIDTLDGNPPFLLLGFESTDKNGMGCHLGVVDIEDSMSFRIEIYPDVIVIYFDYPNQKVFNRFTENVRTYLDVDFDVTTDEK